MTFCNLCGKPSGEKVLACSVCRSVFYCCREHQKGDWKNHKAICSTRSSSTKDSMQAARYGKITTSEELSHKQDECMVGRATIFFAALDGNFEVFKKGDEAIVYHDNQIEENEGE